MTHHQALEQSRRALDHREDCHHELVEAGSSISLPGTTRWLCEICNVVLLIDPTGVIRDTVPVTLKGESQ